MNNYLMPNGKTLDFWFISICAFFAVVHLHYLILVIFTRNWTIWATYWYVFNYILFFPVFVFIYDRAVTDTPIYHSIVEIVFNGIFWLVNIISVAACLLPIYFYFTIQNLLAPTLTDLVIQDKINY